MKGRRRRLSDKQLTKLEKLLAKGSLAHGWQNNLWTSLRVREVIKDHFGITFCRSQVWHILTDYLGWSARRPVQQAKKRNQKAIERWKFEEFPRILKDSARRNAYVVFVDETGFMMSSVVRRTFAAPGTTPVTKVSDPHGRISTIGAIIISPHYRSLHWHHHLLQDNVNFRGPDIVDFLQSLSKRIAAPMTIIWDSIIIHWSNAVCDYLATATHISSILFPPYAPELNPVDRAWFYVKYDRLPNFAPPNMTQLRASVEDELRRLDRLPHLLRSFIRHSDLPSVI